MAMLCNCCGIKIGETNFVVKDVSGTHVNIYECSNCSAFTPYYAVETEKDCTQIQIEKHEMQWSNSTATELDSVAAGLEEVVKFYQNKGILKHPSAGYNVGEIGTGRGCLLYTLNKMGYDATGCEPSSLLVDISTEHFSKLEGKVFCKTADEFIESRCSDFDVVFLWHVIEHIESPLDLLANVVSSMSENGVIIAQVPLLATPWIYPEHLFLFTEKTVHWISRILDLSIEFCEVSVGDQFLSFVLKKKKNFVNNVEVDFDGWQEEKLASIQDLIKTNAALSNDIERLNIEILSDRKLIDERDVEIRELKNEACINKNLIVDQENIVQALEKASASDRQLIDERDDYITNLEKASTADKKLIDERDSYISNLEKINAFNQEVNEERDARILRLEEKIASSNKLTSDKNELIKCLDLKVNSLEADLEFSQNSERSLNSRLKDYETVKGSIKLFFKILKLKIVNGEK